MKVLLKVFWAANCLGLLGCSGDGEIVHQSGTADSADVAVNISPEVLDEMIQSLPQPIEISQIISSSGPELRENLLLPADRIEKLESKYAQALALGAYGVDLGYINLNNGSMHAIEYLGAVRKISEKLQVSQFFDFETLSKLSKSKNNSDSLIQISTDNFNRIDRYLREKGRGEQSILILVGAWIEGMNMLAEIQKASNSSDISKRIAEQKIVFDNIYLIMQKLEGYAFFKEAKTRLEPLHKAYETVGITYNYKKPEMKEVNGQLVLKDQTEMIVSYTAEDLREIITLLRQIRVEYFSEKNDK